jgi:hypothetical protein
MGDRRHAGGGEGPLNRRQLQDRRTQHNGHPGPRHAMQQVRLTQRMGDEGGLTGR